MKKLYGQQLSANLPKEILEQPRFFQLCGMSKGDTPKGWSDPENQKLFKDFPKGYPLGFDTAGHGKAIDYVLFDFDHVLDDDGNWINDEAHRLFKWICSKFKTYCERSISGHGVHILAIPTKGKFEMYSGGKRGTVYFDDSNPEIKLEIFYKTKARYCLFTGNVYQCEPNAPVAHGEAVDAVFQELLDIIAARTKKPPKSTQKPKTKVETKQPLIDSTDYDFFRANIMLDAIAPADLPDTDWLAVISSAKNIGIPYNVVDAWNQQDPDRYNAEENLSRWNSQTDPNFDIETLHGIAKRFGYEEKESRREWYRLQKELSNSPAPMNNDAEPKNETIGEDKFNGYNYLQGDSDDLPNARRLEKFRGKYFRWLADDERWLTYYNGIWLCRSEKNSVLYPIAAQFSDEMFNFAKILAANFEKMKPPTIIHKNYADKTPEEKIYDKAKSDKDKAFRVAGYFQKRKNYSAAIELLKSCSSILVTNADLNGHKNLLCCADCVVDLQTGKIYDFAPENLITNQTNAAYQKFISDEADAFVRKVLVDILPDEATRRAVLRYLGYCLTGERNYQISQFWRGNGANGKSTVLDTLVLLLGSYVVKLPSAALLASMKSADGNAATPALALLDGDKRTAIVDELPQKCRLDAGFFKSLVTDKTMAGRPLYGNFRNIELRAKLILNGNFLPQFSANDKAMRRRINTVEFTQCFEGDRADKNLLSKLAEPSALCAFLRIIVAEAIEFYRNGLLESDAMKQTKAEYISESDFITAFATDNCDIGDGYILRKDFETRLKSEYPAETSLFTKNQLFKAIVESLKPSGVEYTKDRLKNNIFKGISWQQATDDFSGEIISSAEYAMP